jgi:peptidoglycan/LPS O-acetylase OafA/YrhL
MIWLVLRRKAVRVIIVLIVLVPLFRVFLFLFHPAIFMYVLLPCRADALLLGVLSAYLVRMKRSREWLAHNTKALTVIFFCLLAGMAYLVFVGYGHNIRTILELFEMESFGFTLTALFCACLLLIVTVNTASVIRGLLRNRLLRHFGSIAYGMYLMHVAIRATVLDFVSGPGWADGSKKITVLLAILVSLVAFLVLWLLAALSWHFFERPIVRWGHRFRYCRTIPGISSRQQSNTCSTVTSDI